MGSGATKQGVLQCPRGYDEHDFHKICQLFDQLDRDSNFGVSSDELSNIADLHVKNCCKILKGRISAEKQMHQQQQLELKKQHEHKVCQLADKIRWYGSLDQDARQEVFMKVLTEKGEEHVTFWKFFDYMKNKVKDIKNIDATTGSTTE